MKRSVLKLKKISIKQMKMYFVAIVLGAISLQSYGNSNDEDVEEEPLEIWMTAPFESATIDSDIITEGWMTAPFEAGEVVEVEDWMTEDWI